MQSLVDNELMNRIMQLQDENTRYKISFDLLEKELNKKGNENFILSEDLSKIIGIARREIHVIEFVD